MCYNQPAAALCTVCACESMLTPTNNHVSHNMHKEGASTSLEVCIDCVEFSSILSETAAHILRVPFEAATKLQCLLKKLIFKRETRIIFSYDNTDSTNSML